MVHFMQQDYQAALADLKRGLVIDPRHYKALNGLGLVLEELDDKKGALEAFRKALEVNPFLDSARQRIEELFREVEGQDI
jgi:tetratricopeptide (TPR) repeat protein